MRNTAMQFLEEGSDIVRKTRMLQRWMELQGLEPTNGFDDWVQKRLARFHTLYKMYELFSVPEPETIPEF